MKTKKIAIEPLPELCPQCIEPLVVQKKKLGLSKHWFVCTKCGYRERASQRWETKTNAGSFIENIRIRNQRNINRGYEE